jgi:hypothetical protein
MEEEAFGEEEEVLREMEMGEQGMGTGVHRGAVGTAKKVVDGGKGGEVEAGDSQVQGHGQLGRELPGNGDKPGEAEETEEPPVGLLSGFDEEPLHGSSDEDAQQTKNQPLRTFKKRGQKRTTRLVNMRPTRAKRPARLDTNPSQEEEDEIIHDTQFNTANPATTANDEDTNLRLSDLDSSSEVDFDASASEEEAEQEEAASKTKQKKPAPGKDKSESKEKSDGVVKRAVRKVKATAHANFKRLKLRNSGAKGGPGYGSRWRRRR